MIIYCAKQLPVLRVVCSQLDDSFKINACIDLSRASTQVQYLNAQDDADDLLIWEGKPMRHGLVYGPKLIKTDIDKKAAKRGKLIFARNCTGCHGQKAREMAPKQNR